MNNWKQQARLTALLRESPPQAIQIHQPHNERQGAWLVKDIVSLVEQVTNTHSRTLGWYQNVFQPVATPALLLAGYWPEKQLGVIEMGRAGQEVFGKANWVTQQVCWVEMAKELTVRGIQVVVDDETLLYLRLLGGRAAIRANWAVIKGGKRRAWLHGNTVSIEKNEHISLTQPLPCGWDELVLIHRQASLQKSTGDAPLYILDRGDAPYPRELFFAQMQRGVHVPVQEAWVEYLWVEGICRQAITRIRDNCIGYMGWRVEVGGIWEQIIGEGLREGKITL